MSCRFPQAAAVPLPLRSESAPLPSRPGSVPEMRVLGGRGAEQQVPVKMRCDPLPGRGGSGLLGLLLRLSQKGQRIPQRTCGMRFSSCGHSVDCLKSSKGN